MPTLADQIAPKPQEPSGLGGWLASIGDEMAGAFARYGRRSGAQRDASLALMSQAADPNTDPLTGAGMKALGLAGLVTHPLAFFPTGDEWRERLSNAGNTGRMGQAIGGMLGDLPSVIDPQLLVGGGALAAAPIIGKLAGKAGDAAEIAQDVADPVVRTMHQSKVLGTGRPERPPLTDKQINRAARDIIKDAGEVPPEEFVAGMKQFLEMDHPDIKRNAAIYEKAIELYTGGLRLKADTNAPETLSMPELSPEEQAGLVRTMHQAKSLRRRE